MPKRVAVSKARRIRLFKDKNGVCHLCGGKISVGEEWDLSHPIPLELGGADDESNWDIAHRACHREETKVDVANIAKAKRREAKHLGLRKAKGRPLAGTKASGIRKRMNGEVERW